MADGGRLAFVIVGTLMLELLENTSSLGRVCQHLAADDLRQIS